MDHSAAARWPGTPVLAPPDVAFQGSEWTSNELAQLAWRWHRVVVDRDVTDRLLALVLTNHPESVALFFALAALPADLVVLPGDPRAWQSSPPVAGGTRLGAEAHPVRSLPEREEARDEAHRLARCSGWLVCSHRPSAARRRPGNGAFHLGLHRGCQARLSKRCRAHRCHPGDHRGLSAAGARRRHRNDTAHDLARTRAGHARS